ncbi:hypothetical protein SAMN04489713_107123 [Actinomadura madurae]|uniref:Uncharacterized protein n=1 Tax=Actinomadura madurae TaxID=1993 RepID=A0A1I5I5Q1_9ACTN|nr:hypothetical protein SAMN04489713_107123 [Actinomadura madurae]
MIRTCALRRAAPSWPPTLRISTCTSSGSPRSELPSPLWAGREERGPEQPRRPVMTDFPRLSTPRSGPRTAPEGNPSRQRRPGGDQRSPGPPWSRQHAGHGVGSRPTTPQYAADAPPPQPPSTPRSPKQLARLSDLPARHRRTTIPLGSRSHRPRPPRHRTRRTHHPAHPRLERCPRRPAAHNHPSRRHTRRAPSRRTAHHQTRQPHGVHLVDQARRPCSGNKPRRSGGFGDIYQQRFSMSAAYARPRSRSLSMRSSRNREIYRREQARCSEREQMSPEGSPSRN